MVRSRKRRKKSADQESKVSLDDAPPRSIPPQCKKPRRYDGHSSFTAAATDHNDDTGGGKSGNLSSTKNTKDTPVTESRNSPSPRVVDRNKHKTGPRVLWWHSPVTHLPDSVEASLVGTLVRNQGTERGMVRQLPPSRRDQIKKLCKSKQVPLALALSLRRHHIKEFNPTLTMTELGLGEERDIRDSARIFERCVKNFLDKHRIPYWTEWAQRRRAKEQGDLTPPTPDFLFRYPIRIRPFIWKEGKGKKKIGGRKILNEQSAHWLEAKMFYGASTIRDGANSAVGCLLTTARKYVSAYGPGAVVFMQGCGDVLALKLKQAGVLALDCHGTHDKYSVCIDAVHEHQSTWCADEEGQILP